MKFHRVTEHYGYCFERIANKNLFVIYKVKNEKPTYVISAFETKKLAIKECKYLESLNEKRYKNDKRRTESGTI